MAPEILIVGDASRRRGLIREVRDAGYEVTLCQPQELNRRVRTGTPPAMILICIEDADAAVLLATLRRGRRGAAIPVALFGQLGGEIRDLADVLDLGADHFVRDPYDAVELRQALDELAGPPDERAAPAPATRDEVDEPDVERNAASGWGTGTARVDFDARDDVEAARGRGGGRSRDVDSDAEPTGRDPVMGQLQSTLDRLEARLRGRETEGAPASSDDEAPVRRADLVREHLDAVPREPSTRGPHVDLDELGFDRIPDVNVGGGTLDPAGSTSVNLSPRSDLADPDADTFDDGGPELGNSNSDLYDDAEAFDPRQGGTGTGRTESTVRLEQRRADERSGVLAPRRPPRRPGEREVRRGDVETAARGLPRAGNLHEDDVPTLLWRLHRQRATGKLGIQRGRVEKEVWFVAGELTFARSGSSADRFIDDLLRRGVLTRAQYETARRLAAREPRRAGELLIEAGLVKPDELGNLLGDHLSHMIQSTFAWEEGTWSFEPGATVEEPITLEVVVARLIFDGIRQRIETSRLARQLGSDLAAPRLSAAGEEAGLDELAERYDLIEREVDWLERFDGNEPLRVFLDEPEADEHALLALVRALVVTGDVELVGEVPTQVGRDPVEIDKDRVLERLRVARESDYFELLGLPRDATRTEVRRAHAQVSETFADRSLEESTVERMAAELTELRAAMLEARDILMDDALRSAYLAHLDEAPGSK